MTINVAQEYKLLLAIEQNDLPLMNQIIREAGGIQKFAGQDHKSAYEKMQPEPVAIVEAITSWGENKKQPLWLLTAWRLQLALGATDPDDTELRFAYRAAQGLLSSLKHPSEFLRIDEVEITSPAEGVFSVGFSSNSRFNVVNADENSGCLGFRGDWDPDTMHKLRPTRNTYIESSSGSFFDGDTTYIYSGGVLYFSLDSSALDGFAASRPSLKERQDLIIAIQEHDHDHLNNLLSKGVSADEHMGFLQSPYRPMHVASEYANHVAIQMLHDLGSSVSKRLKDRHPPLEAWAASSQWSSLRLDDGAKTLGLLLEFGASVDERGEDGKTALMSACEKSNLHAAHALLEAGADPKLQDSKGNTARDYCIRGGQANECAVLIEAHLASRAIALPLDLPVLRPL